MGSDKVVFWTTVSLVVLAVQGASFGYGSNRYSAGQGNSKRENKGQSNAPGNNNGQGKGPSNNNTQGSNSHGKPEEMELEFDMQGSKIKLNLKKAKQMNVKMPVILKVNGQTKEFKDDEEITVYNDPQSMASIIMADKGKDSNNGRKVAFSGSFMKGKRMYEIKPPPGKAVGWSDDLQEGDTEADMGGMPHRIHPVHTDEKLNFGDEREERGGNKGKNKNTRSDSTASDPTTTYTGGKLVNGVEVLLIVDYASFKKRYDASAASDHDTRVYEAVRDIKYFYIHVMSGIDMRYATIEESDFSIYVRLSGLIIAMTPYDSPWTEGPGIKDADKYTEIYDAIEFLEKWINDNDASLPPFDHAMLFSANELWNDYRSDGSRRTISGLSSIATICGFMRASINHEGSLYSCIQTGAHELGHNLGAYHDSGSTSGDCSYTAQHVMASAPTTLTDTTYKNALTFSTCSRDDFRYHLFNIARAGTSCLLNNATHERPSDFEFFLKKFPGQKFDAKEQCQQIHDDSSFYCGGGNNDARICRMMLCYHPDTDKCYTDAEQRASDGTTCGNGRWCLNGDCVSDWRAPATPDSCIYGDYRDVVGNTGLKCPDLVRLDPSVCYTQTVAEQCCESCKNKEDLTKPGCEFGDKNPYHCETILTRDCYDPNSIDTCCGTCESRHTGIAGCEYGDRASWCSNIKAYECYTSGSTCCSTCENLCNGPAECPCGDRLSYCYQYKPQQCYDSEIEKNCCGHCATLKTGPQGCEYGDRDYYCEKSMCGDSTKWQGCCATCAEEIAAAHGGNSGGGNQGGSTGGTVCPAGNVYSWCDQILSRDCYDTNYQENCCSTCKLYETGIANCKYGDDASWCPDYAKTESDCNTLSDTCCATCYKVLEGSKPHPSTTMPPIDPGCQDAATWCSGIFAGQCYDQSTQDTCCATCSHLVQTNLGPGCEYGNHYSWCKTEYCSTDKEKCCETCS